MDPSMVSHLCAFFQARYGFSSDSGSPDLSISVEILPKKWAADVATAADETAAYCDGRASANDDKYVD